MLSRETMGVFLLGVLWLNTLLVAAASWQRSRDLRMRAKRLFAGTSVVRGRVVRGDGPGGVLAMHSIEQVGRHDDGTGRAVRFHDRCFDGTVAGGAVESAAPGGAIVEVQPSSRVEVWPARSRQLHAASCDSAEVFDAAWVASRSREGFRRSIDTPVKVSDEVWIVGELHATAGTRVVRAPIGESLWISAFDPAPWIARRLAMVVAFIVFVLASTAAITALALQRPWFGPASTLGAAIGIAYFLGILLPGGVGVRELLRAADVVHVRGAWVRPRERSGLMDVATRDTSLTPRIGEVRPEA